MTDIHYSLDRVKQLRTWLTTRNQKLDVVLISGDIADGPMDWDLSDEDLKKYQSDLEEIVEVFTQIKNSVYYIPGNVIKRNPFNHLA